ncbi:MAG TPA: hypothetical protein VJ813_05305 [Vicinamibacterales bacterium]|nr:hypothetical protein [Vicinamibacterales bacterium]
MKGNRAALAAVVAVLVIAAGWWLFSRRTAAPPMPLIPLFASAEKRPPGGTFEVIEADVNGEKKQAIYTVPTSRLIYRIRIPEDAWLKVAVATKPESWTQEGNGVLFRVGVSDGRTYDPMFSQHVNPFGNAGDRKWIQVWVDLSAYASEEVELIFNTNTSPEGQGEDPRNDHALWGAPEIVVR